MLNVYTIEHEEQWDNIVRTFSDYDVYYLSGYVKAFQLHGDGEPMLFYYDDGGTRGINVVMKRDIAKDNNFIGKIPENTYFDFSTPYGYGGWLTEGDPTNIFNEYEKWCVQYGIVSEFVRFHLFTDYNKVFNGIVETHTHNVVRSLDLDLNEIWMDFKQKVRKNVNRANSYGLEIIVDPNGEYLKDFLRIYYGTMDRTKAKDEFYFSDNFFKILNEMHDNIIYFHAAYQRKIISTELVIYGAKNCYSCLGGTDSKYFDMRPNDFLKYEIIKWAKGKDLKYFVLGGGYGKDDGIFEYKKCLSPHGVTDFYIGKKIFDKEKYDYLCELRKPDPDTDGFFPKYRS